MTTLPCAECRGECCTLAPFTRDEFEHVRRLHGVPSQTTVVDTGVSILVLRDRTTGVCGYLDPAGRCSIHADRPLVCRLYGEVPEMVCDYVARGVREAAESRGGGDALVPLRISPRAVIATG